MGLRKNIRRFIAKVKYQKSLRRNGPNTKLHLSSDKVMVGEHTYGMPEILLHAADNKLIIGKFCSIADGVEFLMGGTHHGEFVSTYPWYNVFPNFRRWDRTGIPDAAWCDRPVKDTVVGNDVWIGRSALIMPGVTIGDGAIIGSRTVVSKDVPPYAVVVGSPMRIIRYRFSETQIAALLAIKWWEWSDEKVQRFLPLIAAGDIDAFIAAAEKENAQ